MSDQLTATGAPDSAAHRKRTDRILTAAEHLFLTYGMRRTSIDDIAQQAGIAKGTVYLSFKSKESLFSALAERIVAQFQERAESAAAKESDLVDKLVAYLDEAVGEPARLLASTPHASEILAAKNEFAADIMSAYHAGVQKGLAEISGQTGDLTAMLVEAAHGCKETGPLSSSDYRARLHRHISTLLRGAG